MSRPNGRLSDEKFSEYLRVLNKCADDKRLAGQRKEAKRIIMIRDLAMSNRNS